MGFAGVSGNMFEETALESSVSSFKCGYGGFIGCCRFYSELVVVDAIGCGSKPLVGTLVNSQA